MFKFKTLFFSNENQTSILEYQCIHLLLISYLHYPNQTVMRKLSIVFLFVLFITLHSIAQTGQILNPDQVVTTEHTVTVKGNKIPYKAIAGTLPVYGDSGKIIAGVFFTYY